MGGFAPGKLKSRRGWRSSPRRLRYRFRLRPGIQELTAGDSINFWPVAILSPLSTCGALAHSGPPKWPSLSPPPTTTYELYNFLRPHSQQCELDHSVSLEVGGADALSNIWPECCPG